MKADKYPYPFLAALAISAVILGTVLIIWSVNQPASAPTGSPIRTEIQARPKFTSNVLGCAKTGQASRGISLATGQPLLISAVGSMITYRHELTHACCLSAQLRYSIRGQVITFSEVWSGEPCRCQCSSVINGTIENVPKGVYTVESYAQNERINLLDRRSLTVPTSTGSCGNGQVIHVDGTETPEGD